MRKLKRRFISLTTLLIAGVLSCVAVAPSSAVAQEKDANAEFTRANKLASAGAYTRSIPHYERVLEIDPRQYAIAFFNLAEVWKAKEECVRAALYYRLYIANGSDEQTLKQAETAFESCRKGEEWPALTVKVEPEETSEVLINGYPLGGEGKVKDVVLPPGKYQIEATAIDHHPSKKEVELERGENEQLDFDLKEMIFHGTVRVKVNIAGATVKIHEGPSDETEVVATASSPMKESAKVTEGRHFVEVTMDGYDRWIRNVQVRRDEETTVDVRLRRSLPEEIR